MVSNSPRISQKDETPQIVQKHQPSQANLFTRLKKHKQFPHFYVKEPRRISDRQAILNTIITGLRLGTHLGGIPCGIGNRTANSKAY